MCRSVSWLCPCLCRLLRTIALIKVSVNVSLCLLAVPLPLPSAANHCSDQGKCECVSLSPRSALCLCHRLCFCIFHISSVFHRPLPSPLPLRVPLPPLPLPVRVDPSCLSISTQSCARASAHGSVLYALCLCPCLCVCCCTFFCPWVSCLTCMTHIVMTRLAQPVAVTQHPPPPLTGHCMLPPSHSLLRHACVLPMHRVLERPLGVAPYCRRRQLLLRLRTRGCCAVSLN
jgi:hypothetical protein